jgi:hypothetical protein
MEKFNVLNTEVIVFFADFVDTLYATATHSNRFALEEVSKLLQAKGWLLDEMVWCGGYWSLSMCMETSEVVI